MDAFKTHGAFSWNELSTTDPAAAATFYAALFGWSVKEMGAEMGGYRVVSVGETGVGGIMKCPEGQPIPPHWGAYVTVDDVEQTIAKCTELGGKVVVPPMDVPNVGRMALLQDPQGAVISVIAYAMER
jgi:predicted enzyme related to lactoylglutathione lyase